MRKLNIVLMLAALLFASSELGAQILRLRTGKFLIGSVETATEDGVRFKRLDTGGLLDLDWDDINAGDATVLRKRFHLVTDEETADVLIEARSIEYSRGGTRRTYVGELVSRNAVQYVLRKRGVTVTVPIKEMRAPPEVVRVPILDILTPDAIYQRKLAEVDPGEDANKHLLLAIYLIRVTDYERAKQHLLQAQELGGGEQPKEVDRQLARVEELIKHKEEADLIAQINILRNRKHFKKALEACADFEQRFPESKLMNEFKKRKDAVMRDRETWLVHNVTFDWYSVLHDEAGKIARQEESYDAAISKAEDELPDAIRERIGRKRGISPEEVTKYFGMRHERKVGKIQPSSYSSGSWILGEKEVIKGTAAEKAMGDDKKDKKQTREDRLKAELAKRMKEWLRKANKARSRGGPGQGQELQTEQQWWKEASTVTKRLFIKSWYAEKRGDMKVVSAHVTKCPTCGAKGTLQVQGAVGGKVQNLPCPFCHKTRWIRGIRYK